MELVGFLLLVVWPLVKAVLVPLGVGVVTFAAYSALASYITGLVSSSLGGMTAASLAVLTLGGEVQALGIILSAFVARAAVMAVGRLGLLGA